MDSIDDMPFRKYMDKSSNPLMPGSTVPCEVPVEDQTDIEIIYDNLLDPRFNPLIDGSTVDAMPCGHGDTECERRAMQADLRRLGATDDEIQDIMRGYQNDPGCHECNG